MDINELTKLLAPTECKVQCVEQTGSTNTDLLIAARAGDVDRPILRYAQVQTAGRGTRGRYWTSHAGCITMSVAVPIGDSLNAFAGASLAIGAHIVERLRHFGFDACIKWPNDILLGNGKLAGILVESAKTPDHQWVLVIGIGFNWKTSDVQNPSYGISFLSQHGDLGKELSKREFWVALLAKAVLQAVEEIRFHGLTPTVMAWDKISAYIAETVNIIQENVAPYQARILGIDTEGRLLIEHDGQRCALISGSIRQLVPDNDCTD